MNRTTKVAALAAALLLSYGAGQSGSFKRSFIREAEREALEILEALKPVCESRKQVTEAWAKINSDNPKGYEIIGNCVTVR